ncbi:MAG: DUF308 domain-containing protein [Oscillospiraceae bacterium]|nr:DUF308 domain-containing protein [Oscillospiraceae bacterium]
MASQFKGMKVAAALIGFIMIMVGLFLIFVPLYIIPLFSGVVAVSGAVLIAKYLAAKDTRNGWDLITGIMHIIFGAIMLTGDVGTRALGVLSIEWVLSIWILFAGVLSIGNSLALKKSGNKGWGWALLGSILSVIAGIIFIMFPIRSALVAPIIFGKLVGVSMMITGFTTLAVALSGKHAANEGDTQGAKE